MDIISIIEISLLVSLIILAGLFYTIIKADIEVLKKVIEDLAITKEYIQEVSDKKPEQAYIVDKNFRKQSGLLSYKLSKLRSEIINEE